MLVAVAWTQLPGDLTTGLARPCRIQSGKVSTAYSRWTRVFLSINFSPKVLWWVFLWRQHCSYFGLCRIEPNRDIQLIFHTSLRTKSSILKNILLEIDNDVQTKGEGKFNHCFYYPVFLSNFPSP